MSRTFLCLTLTLLIACNQSASRDARDTEPGGALGDAAPDGDDGDDGAPPRDAEVEADADGGGDGTALDAVIVSCAEEDGLHPNHDAEMATPVRALVSEPALYACPDEDDWFRVDAAVGQRITATIAFADRNGDLDLYLLQEGAASLDDAVAVSGTREDTESLTHAVTTAGAYFIVVHSFEGAAGAYRADIVVSCRSSADCGAEERCSFVDGHCVTASAGLCGGDANEPNDDLSSATALVPGADGFAFAHGLFVCEEDDDVFVVPLDVPSTAVFDLAADPGADADLFLFDESGRLLAVSENHDGSAERIERSLSPAGRLVAIVRPYVSGVGATVGYNLTVEVRAESCASDRECAAIDGRQQCVDGGCVAFEPASPSGPAGPCDDDGDCAGGLGCLPGGGGVSTNLCTSACGSDGDCAYMEGGSCLALGFDGVCFPPCGSDTDCPALYSCTDSACALVECRLDADCVDGRVCRRSEQQNRGFCTAVTATACRDDDAREPNDTQSAAVEIEPGLTRALTICDDNDDWFSFSVAGDGTRAELEATFDGTADLDVYVFDAAGRTVGAGTDGAANPETAFARALAAGTYFVRVNQFPGDRPALTPYDLRLTFAPESCTIAAEDCLDLQPLRVTCDEALGACVFLEGDGAVPLGGLCDSSDDCAPEAEFCWTREPATARRNICTLPCEGDAGCAGVEGTTCERIGRGFSLCLP